MYKNFILNMIRNAIEKEFSFKCALVAKIEIIADESGEVQIAFSFETIFENQKVYGWIDDLGNVDFLTTRSYDLTKEYYKKYPWELKA